MSYKTYEYYKDSEILWMEKVPCDWKINRLKFLCVNLDNKRIPISADNRKDGPFPYYGAAGIVDYIDDYIFDDKLVLIGEDGAPFFENGKNVSFIVNGKMWVNNHAHVLKVKEDLILSEFLVHILNCTDYSLYIKGSTRDKLNQDQLNNIPILIPNIQTQESMVSYLDKKTSEIDDNIAKNKELISLLEEKKTALINQVVTKGLDPNVPMKDSGIEWIGEIPEHWEIRKMKNLTFFQEGPGLRNWQFTDYGIRVICVTNITEKGIDFKNYEKFISEEEYKQIYQHFTVNKGDLLLSSSGNSWGKVAQYNDEEIVILNTSTIRINENKDFGSILSQSFIKWSLESETVREQLGLMMTGSCQPNFGPTHLAKVLVPYPTSKMEQNNISKYLDEKIGKLNEIIEKVKNEMCLLEEYKTSLIHHTVTGKIDVRDEI